MAGAIQRRHEVWQQQHDQQNQQQISDNAQIRRFWLMAGGPGRQNGQSQNDIALIVPGFSSGFKARPTRTAGIDEAGAINDCPAKSIRSCF
jgi:hypothetical protein